MEGDWSQRAQKGDHCNLKAMGTYWMAYMLGWRVRDGYQGHFREINLRLWSLTNDVRDRESHTNDDAKPWISNTFIRKGIRGRKVFWQAFISQKWLNKLEGFCSFQKWKKSNQSLLGNVNSKSLTLGKLVCHILLVLEH